MQRGKAPGGVQWQRLWWGVCYCLPKQWCCCRINLYTGKFTSGFTAHGPALMLKYEHPDATIQFPIHIDIAPAINAHLSFEQLRIQWPRTTWWTPWPQPGLQRSVKAKGVMLVAKQNFFWSVSFAECEKELSKHADEDGGNRKQVHRLIKMFYDRFWKKETKQLNSYMLKVNSTRVVFDVELLACTQHNILNK